MAKVVNCFCYFCCYPPQGFGICTFNWAGNWSLTLKFLNKLLLDEYWKKNQSKLTYWEKNSGGDNVFVKIASQPAQSFGGWKRIKVLKFPSTYHERTLKSSQTLKHNSKSSTAPKSQFHIRRTRIEQKHRIARIWSFSLNNKWLENGGQQLACPKVVLSRKAKATLGYQWDK